MDLVAHLIRKQLDILTNDEKGLIDANDFKFVFYVSFQNREQAIALELLEKFDQLCKKMGSSLFELHVRLGDSAKEKWDGNYLEKALEKRDNVKKVWVCGPPKMNEEFDKFICAQKTKQASYTYEIM